MTHLAVAVMVHSLDHGLTWSGPEKTGCLTASLNLKQVGDGTIFLSGSHYRMAGLQNVHLQHHSQQKG